MSIVVYNEVETPIVPTPLELQIFVRFGSAIQGMYDFMSPQALYQDAAGTIPVTAHDQPIGRAEDKGDAGHHLTQPTTAARPTYTAQGARHDGVDDFLQAELADDWTFLHDGSGGTLGISGSWEGEVASPAYTGTQSPGGNSVGTSTGLRSSALGQGFYRVGSGVANAAGGSETGSWAESVPASLLISYAVPTVARWFDGSRLTDVDASALTPSSGPPENPLRTMIQVTSGIQYRRRIIAISEAITDPADIALLDAWLREGS